MNPTRPTAGAAGTADKMCRTESGVNLDGLSGAEKIVYATASAWVSSGQTARPSRGRPGANPGGGLVLKGEVVMYGRFVIARSRDQGVVTGYLRSMAGRSVELTEARQVHWWTGANTLFEMSLRGCGEQARISEPVAEILMTEVCGVIPCTAEAETNLRRSRWHTS